MASSDPSRTRPIAASLLQVLLFLAVCLPTGSIFGLNVKVLVLAAFFAAFISYLATSSSWLTSVEVIGLGLFTAAVCFWSLVAILDGQSDIAQVFLHLKDIASTVVLAWLCIFFVRRGLLRPESVIATVVSGIAALSVMKLALVAAMFAANVDPIQVLEAVFGQESLIGGSITFGLTRMQFSSDIIGSFALFAILCPSVSGIRVRRISTVLLVLLLLASGLLAYARYLWFLEGFAIIAAMIIERKFKLLAAAILATVLVTSMYYETLQPFIEGRFFSEQTTDSDLTRIEQSRALVDEIKARPLFGKGLGTHVNTVIRSEHSQYSYELQWMSLLMQFGVVGIVGILLLLATAARDLLASRHRARPWVALLFALWLLSAWTNPYLTSSFAGATFGMFMAMFYRMRNRPSNSDSHLLETHLSG
jgi:hypothetical protein